MRWIGGKKRMKGEVGKEVRMRGPCRRPIMISETMMRMRCLIAHFLEEPWTY